MKTTSSTHRSPSDAMLWLFELARNDLSQNAPRWFLVSAGLDPGAGETIGSPGFEAPETLPEARSPETGGEWKPRTDLGRRLAEIRARIVSSGEKLLSWEEIEEELKDRRGERETEE